MEEAGKRKPLRPSPRLIAFQGVEGEGETIYYLYIDLRVLCGLRKFSKALIMWFFSFYIFNLEYAKPLREICLFFQEFV